jgi:Ca2+-binding RTX toxin-like protein
MQGGLGNDTYFVNALGDRVIEAGAGIDRIYSSLSHALAANVETLVLTGTAALNGTGNTLNNLLVGNAAANVLNGSLGNDIMQGGLGNDTYHVNAAGDRVIEAGVGIDRVISSVSHTLAANVETLVLTGSTPINGIGNTLNNLLAGNGARNVLVAGAGNDILHGGAGNDLLFGSLGRDLLAGGPDADTFVYRAAAESPRGALRDVVQDFQHGVDHINLVALDANLALAGDQAFTFVGARAFSGVAGELSYRAGLASADMNGDRIADLEVMIANHAVLTQEDFVL